MISKEMIPDKKYWFIIDNEVYPVEFTQEHLNIGDESAFGDLFETKKEAEIHLEFVGIKREEEFPYISLEEFRGGKKLYANKNSLIITTQTTSTLEKEIIIWNNGALIFRKPLTEENYYEALRIAKKKFLGEEV